MKEKEFELFKILSHPTRAMVIELLSENGELSYTQILNTLCIDTGQLNFHLKRMLALLQRTESGYTLTAAGRTAHKILEEARWLLGSGEQAESAFPCDIPCGQNYS